MTINEFVESITDWWDLKNFCDEYGCYICDDIYDDDGVNGYINDRLYDMCREESWEDVRDWLNNFADSYGEGYYRIDEYGDIYYMDEADFQGCKEEVLQWALRDGAVEEYDEDEDLEEEGSEPEEVCPYEAPEFSFDELYTESNVVLNTINKASEAININELWV